MYTIEDNIKFIMRQTPYLLSIYLTAVKINEVGTVDELKNCTYLDMVLSTEKIQI